MPNSFPLYLLPFTLAWLLLTPAPAAAAPALVPDVSVDLAGLPGGPAHDEDVVEYGPGGPAIATVLPPIPGAAAIQAFTMDGPDALFTPDTTVVVAGVVVEPRDIARWDGSTLTLELDGSAAGVPNGLEIDALAFSIATGNLLISVDSSAQVGPLAVDDEDLFRLTPTPLLIFDGSLQGIDPALDLVGFDMSTPEEGLFTFDGSGVVDGIHFDDEDLLVWNFTTGDFALYLDTSSLDSEWSGVDVQAVPEPSAAQLLAFGSAALFLMVRRSSRRGRPARPLGLVLLSIGSATLGATSAFAGDGRIEINQARAIAGGVTASDAPGFPVTLMPNASYVLTSDLAVPTGTTGIDGAGTLQNVSLDLNGFTIRGPVICLSNTSDISCSATGPSQGIDLEGWGITIKNGSVTGFAGGGISIGSLSRSVRIESLHVYSNSLGGIQVDVPSVIRDCVVDMNDGVGIKAGFSSRVSNNVVTSNDVGLALSNQALGEGNLVTIATVNGVAIDLTAAGPLSPGLRGNYVLGPVNGSGFDLGGNVCSGSTSCP